jgi:PKD repeat protein
MGLNNEPKLNRSTMRSSFRSLFFGLATLLSAGAMAQYPYYIALSGTVGSCYSGQVLTVQTVQGTLPQQSYTVTVNSNCTYSITVPVSNQPAWLEVTTACGGAFQVGSDSSQFNFIGDTAYSVIDLNCGGGGTYDCLNILNGPNMPGTPCNDNDPLTVNDAWSPTCACQGVNVQNCQAAFSIALIGPWAIQATNQSSGVTPLAYQWWMPDGTTSTATNPIHTFTAPGTYGICLTITSINACTSVSCDTIYVDSTGTISLQPGYYDCMGIPNGSSLPGTPCDDGNPLSTNDTWTANCGCTGIGGGALDCLGVLNGTNLPGTACVDSIGGLLVTGIWTANCVCQTNSAMDCLGIINGPNVPGSPCNDGDTLTVQDTWSPSCVCVGVPVNYYDCLGMLNGPDLPGTPCDDGDPGTINDTWNANCACMGANILPCNADFWVLQAVTYDSLNQTTTPIPYELWIWNLSSGGGGTYTTFWSFGDGSSSTAQFPTHTYAGNGPYLLCLTIDDGMGCTSTYCDSVSIDSNGLYTGIMGGGNDRQNGFTINVQGYQTTGLNEQSMLDGIAAWPNPVANELNIALNNAVSGSADVTVLDMEGRVVHAERRMLANGRNQLLLQTSTLSPGLYTVRISNGAASISQRFVKVN